MTAQIRPNRMEVSDRFPMLGFAVRVDQPNVEAQVVLATDVTLFDAANKPRRTAANFYCSDEQGRLSVPRGDGVFVVPPEVLARFIGGQKLYFGLATGTGGLSVDALPREGSPYVALSNFTGRSLRRSYTASRTAPVLEWAGDVPTPGSRPVAPSSSAPVGIAPAPGGGGSYDDGFGPMPDIPAKAAGLARSAPMAAGSRGVALSMSSGLSASSALNWIMEKVRSGAATLGSEVSPPHVYRLGGASGTFTTAWQAYFGVTGIINPANAFLAALPTLAAHSGVTLSIGPALDTPLFGGGVGVVFAPGGDVALFGTGEINVDASGIQQFLEHLKLVLQAKIKLGYNAGGIDGFASLRKVAGINVGEEIVGGAELWLNGADQGIGGAVSIGVGFALQLGADDPYRQRTAPGRGVALNMSSGLSANDALNWIMEKVRSAAATAGSDVSPPHVYRLGGASSTFVTGWQVAFGVTALLNPANAFLAALPTLASRTGVTLSIGPALDTPLFGGGIGVVFAPSGEVALFGAGEISADASGIREFLEHLKLALQAKVKLGYNAGGIDGFASLRKVAAVNAGEEIVVGAELWLNGADQGIGGAVSIGAGFALQLAAEDRPRAVPGRGLALSMSSGLSASSALNWIMEKVRSGAAALGSEVSPPHVYRLGGASGAFTTAWQAYFGVTGLVNPANAFLAAIPTLAAHSGVTLSIGPALDTPVFGGGVGVVFAPGGDVAVFGTAEINIDASGIQQFLEHLKLALQAKVKLGYNSGGIDGFASLRKVAGINVGEEIVVGAELWLNGADQGIGGAVSIGVGFALQLAADDPAYVPPALPGGARERANRIGGAFATRIGEALDLGLAETAVTPLLDKLEAPTTPKPLHAAASGLAYGDGLPPPPPAQTRALDIGAAATIAGTVIQIIATNTGDIHTNLSNWSGVKHPNDVAPSPSATFQQGEIALRDWPVLGATFGIDDIYCWLKIRWQYNGTSLGRIYISDDGHDDALDWGLTVNATIEDDSRLYPRSARATVPGAAEVPALHIDITYTFDNTLADDQIANTRITLYADGTHDIASRWIQHSRPGGGTPTTRARPLALA